MAPTAAPQNPRTAPTIAPRRRPIPRTYGSYYENRLVEELQATGPASIWRIVNACASGDEPQGRREERGLRLEYLRSLKQVLKRRAVLRIARRFVCLPAQESLARQRFTDPKRKEAEGSICHTGRGNLRRQYTPPRATTGDAGAFQVREAEGTERKRLKLVHCSNPSQSQSVPSQQNMVSTGITTTPLNSASAKHPEHDRQAISEAGRTLGKLPRRAKKHWTGWIGTRRCWRGRLVVLPEGGVAPVMWTSRGRVLLKNVHDLPFTDWAVWGARREKQLQIYRNPAAVILGQRKRGVRERRSDAKAEAARANGRLPPRPGRKPRGRPRWAADAGVVMVAGAS